MSNYVGKLKFPNTEKAGINKTIQN